MSNFLFKVIEQKWQEYWEENKSFSFAEGDDKNYYVLSMFPYPSGALHVGHVRNYVLGDVLARFKKAQGFNVLHPMGWDAFGLPAENAALTHKKHPKDWTYANIANMRKQLKKLGLSYDWSREFATCDPSYFKFEQEMFISFWEKGLVQRKDAFVNWDPVDQTILANEQVENGRGWRSGALVEKKLMCQWFISQSDFAEELLSDIDSTMEGWPPAVRTMQRNWIGRSEGALVRFEIEGQQTLEVFSTRPETLYGCSFCAVSLKHALTEEAKKKDPSIAEALVGAQEFDEQNQESIFGVALPFFAIHPLTQKKIPVFAVNYVLQEYGTGSVFGCPAHDERDFRFAKKYEIPIKSVISVKDINFSDNKPLIVDLDDNQAVMENSESLNGMTCAQARAAIIAFLEKEEKGQGRVQYRLRDWCVSRQRYWGTPVPMTHCDTCGPQPVSRANLPVELPEDPKFGQGNPLNHDEQWQKTTCGKCGGPARRDTDTLDTFFESCWYFLRFASQPEDKAFDPEDIKRLLPVDFYIGGVEHAVLHLLYARLFMLLLKKCGYLNQSVPFRNLLTQGMVCYRTYRKENGEWVYPSEVVTNKEGEFQTQNGEKVIVGPSEKMSKSKKNVVDIDTVVDAYGTDALRVFIVADAPPSRHFDWCDEGLSGSWRFSKRIHSFFNEHKEAIGQASSEKAEESFKGDVHRVIFQVTSALETMRTHVAVAQVRILFNSIFEAAQKKNWGNVRLGWEVFCSLADPFMPHICAEMRELSGLSIKNIWPSYDKSFLQKTMVSVAIQINKKMRGTVEVSQDATQQEVEEKACDIIQKYLQGRAHKRIVFVPNRILSIIE